MTNDSWRLWKDLDLAARRLHHGARVVVMTTPSLTYPLNTARAPCDPSGGKVRAM